MSPQERSADSAAELDAFVAEAYASAKSGKARAERKAEELEASRPDVPMIASHWRCVAEGYAKLMREIESKYPDATGTQP